MLLTIEGGGYQADIDVSRGANCVRLTNSTYGADILRSRGDATPDNPFLYGMPILYPVNRISGGRFTFEGRDYRFPVNEPKTGCHLHGELHRMPFSIVEQGTDFVRCAYTAENYLGFPHKFRIDISYFLSEQGLRQETAVTNLSETNMPHFLGFHTTFRVPFLQGAKAEDVRVLAEVGDEIERNMAVYLPTGRILPEDAVTKALNNGSFRPLSQKLSRHYRAGGSGAIVLYDSARHMKVVYENDAKFGWRLIYNGDADEYICLEPQTCMANCQNVPFDRDYAGFDALSPHETKTYVSKIFLEEVKKS
ncbi:MAG: aldose 1-epimerase [Clostridia bacterium]|nr:aldose 1-epimerase [Clostridia bacterium]